MPPLPPDAPLPRPRPSAPGAEADEQAARERVRDGAAGALPMQELAAQELDAIGLLCPLPVLRARKRLLAMAPGEVLCVLASDPAAMIDLPHFCAEAGHGFLGMEERPEVAGQPVRAYRIRRGPQAPGEEPSGPRT